MVRKVLWMAAVVMVAGCASGGQKAQTAGSKDPDARVVDGLIMSLRPTTSTMVVVRKTVEANDPLPAFPNFVYVKYDAATAIFLDDKPATLDQLMQYMPVHVEGRMKEGAFVAGEARFSSKLPANVVPAAQ